MSVDLSARSRVEAMHGKWDAVERQSGQAPPPALGRRRQVDASSRSPHLKRPPLGGRRQHGGRVPAAAAAGPNSLEMEFPVVQRLTFVPSLGISPSALGRKPAQQHRCCQKCLPISRAGYSEQPSSSSSGVKDLLVVEPKSKSLLAKLFPAVAFMNEKEMDYSLTGYEVVDEVVQSERVSNGVRSSTAAEVERADGEGPGPGAYSPFDAPTQSSQQTDKTLSKRKHYLCLSAPAIPPLPDPPLPGPGAYEMVDYTGGRKMASDGAMFRSTTARWEAPVLEEDAPGPGSYFEFPNGPGKQSFLYNVHKQWI